MIVMAIIGVITAASAIPYSNYVKNARDARRKLDLQNMSAALELYRSNDINSSYPQLANALAPSYIKSLPTDPKTKVIYPYTPTCDTSTGTPLCSTYSIKAVLEKDGTTYTVVPGGSSVLTPTPAPTTVPTNAPLPTGTNTDTEVRPTAIPTPIPTLACKQAGSSCSVTSECCSGLTCISSGGTGTDENVQGESTDAIGIPGTKTCRYNSTEL
jgi:general secretion pathway protein G